MVAAAETKPGQELVTFSVQPITYEFTKAEIEKAASAAMMLRVNDVNDKEGCERCQKEQAKIARMTSVIEKQRVAQKKDYLEGGRRVDAIAKELAKPLEEAKAHLQEQRDIVAREQARIQREAEEKQASIVRHRLDLLRACDGFVAYLEADVARWSDEDFTKTLGREQDEQKARAAAAAAEAAERERIAEQQRLEALELAKQRQELDRQRREQEAAAAKAKADAEHHLNCGKARMELLARYGHEHQYTLDQLADKSPNDWERLSDQARQEKQQRDRAAADAQAALDKQREEQAVAQEKINAENKRLADAEAAAKHAAEVEQAKRDAAEKARLDAIAEQERKAAAAKAQAEADAAEEKRQAELRPDREKIAIFADTVAKLETPKLSDKSKAIGDEIAAILLAASKQIRAAGSKLK